MNHVLHLLGHSGRPGTAWRRPALPGLLLLLLLAAVVLAGRRDAASADRPEQALIPLVTAAGGPHPTGTAANERVGAEIYARLSQIGLQPQWQRTARCRDGSCMAVANIIAVRTADPKATYLLVAAHYDSAPASPGAADNLLAVAAMLDFARELVRGRGNVILLFTDGEEFGSAGAAAFAETHPLANRIEFIVNLDSLAGRGPLLVYDLGPEPAASISRLRDIRSARHSTLFDEIGRSFPNDTDLGALARERVPGISAGFMLGDQTYHLPEDDPNAIPTGQAAAMASLVRELAAAPKAAERTGSAPIALRLVTGQVLALPGWSWAPPMGLAAILLLLGLARAEPAARRPAGRGVVTLIAALLCAAVMAFLARELLAGDPDRAALLRLLSPIWPILAFWAVLAVAFPNERLDFAIGVVLGGGALLAVAAGAPGHATVLAIAAAFHALARTRPLIAAAVTSAWLVAALGEIGWLALQMSHAATHIVVDLFWLPLWTAWAAAFGSRERAPSGRLFTPLLAAAAGLASVVAWWQQPASRGATANVDVVERRDLGVAHAMLRTSRRSDVAEGFADRGVQLIPWGDRGTALQTRPVACCRMNAGSATRDRALPATSIAADPQAISHTLFVPDAAAVDHVEVNGREKIRFDTLRVAGGYRYLSFRGSPDAGWRLRFAGRGKSPIGAYLVTEKLLAPARRTDLLGALATLRSGYVPDRHLAIAMTTAELSEGDAGE